MDRRNYWIANKRFLNYGVYFAIPLLIYCIFIVGGFSIVFTESLGYIKNLGLTDITINHYLEVISSNKFIKGMLFSLYVAFLSAGISTFLGVYLAQYIIFSSNNKTKEILDKTSKILVILPYLYVVFFVIWTLSDSGVVARILYVFGIEIKLGILYDSLGIGVILTYVLKGAPFVCIYVYSIMSKIRKDYYTLAMSMGANRIYILRSIYIPLCKNAIIWSSVIIFAYSLGSFEVPMLLTNIKQTTLSQQVYQLYTSPNFQDIPKAMALNIVILIINIIFGAIYAVILNKIIKRGVK